MEGYIVSGVSGASNRHKLLFCSCVHATLHPALLVGMSACPSVTLNFFYDFYFWTSLLLPKWSCDLKYGPCPPAHDFGSRVSGLVTITTHYRHLSYKGHSNKVISWGRTMGMVILKIFEKTSKCNIVGLGKFSRLEMAKDWRKTSLIETSPDTRPIPVAGGQGRKCAFSHFLTCVHGSTDQWTNRRTTALIDLRVCN